MLLSHTPSYVGGMNRSRIMTVHAAKGGGFGSRRNKSSRRSKPATPEVQKLVGEYSVLKQTNSSSSSSTPASGRAPAPDRTKRPTTEASAATGQHTKPAASDPGSSSSSSVVAGKPSTAAPTSTGSNSKSIASTSSTAAEPAKPTLGQTSAGSSKDGAAAAASSKAPTSLPVVPPVSTSFTAAGTRISSFESKLTSRTPAPIPADDEPASPTAAAAAAAAGSVPAASVAKLGTAHDDLAAAEEHVEGLAQLLREAQSTLASLRTDPAATEGGSTDPAAAAVSAAADSLVSMMSDVLSDITAEMGLVREQLVAACSDIDEAKQQLEAAVKAAEPVVPPGKTSAKETFKEDIDIMAAREAAAVAAAAAAVKRESEIKQTLELRNAELAIAQQRTTQLQAQLELLMSGEDNAAAAAGDGSSAVDPRVHQLLVAQVSSNMAMLDWLGALAKTVVGLEGVSPKDRVKLATTISRCVLAVGGSPAGSSGAGNAAADSEAAEQQQELTQDEF